MDWGYARVHDAGRTVVADLTDLSVQSTVFCDVCITVPVCLSGKVLCHPRDLISQPLVIVGVVQEGYAHWRLGGKSVARIYEKRGKRCVRDLLVKDLYRSNSFPAECRRARATCHEV